MYIIKYWDCIWTLITRNNFSSSGCKETAEYYELERWENLYWLINHICCPSVLSVSVVYKGMSTYEYILKQRQLQSSRQQEEGTTQPASSNGAASQVASPSRTLDFITLCFLITHTLKILTLCLCSIAPDLFFFRESYYSLDIVDGFVALLCTIILMTFIFLLSKPHFCQDVTGV